MRNKLYILLIIIALVINSNSYNYDLPYDDIDNVPWAWEAIEYFYNQSTQKPLDNKFYPSDHLKRCDVVKDLVHLFHLTEINGRDSFSDVPYDAFYSYEISTAKLEGWIFGDNFNNFRPEDYITREEYAVILYRIAEKNNKVFKQSKDIINFKDSDISEYAYEAILWLANQKIINGFGDGYFYPHKLLTRAEWVQMTYNFVNLLDLTFI